MKHRLGVDLGTNSIGWWLVTLGDDGRPNGSLAGGVRIFSDGRNPKDGSSLAVMRRVPRGMRRRRDRYLRRRHDLMNVLIATGLMPPDITERKNLQNADPYALRDRAAREPVAPHELGRALFHLNQRRGFKSNRKTDKNEDTKTSERINELRRRIAESGSSTLGQYLYRRRQKDKMVRARPEAGFYPDRALYEDEFDFIRRMQEVHHRLSGEQWEEIRDTIFFQRPLKPVEPGWCLLESGEKRAHRALPATQEFRMVQEANNLRIVQRGQGSSQLSQEQRDKVLTELRNTKELKLEKLLKLLRLPEGTTVNLLDENRTVLKGDETAARLSHKDIFGKAWRKFSFERRSVIVQKLLETEQPDEIARIGQVEWGLDEAAATKLAHLPLPEGYARLSEKAIRKLLPIMEDQGLGYAEAAAEVPEYGHHSDFRSNLAHDQLPYYAEVMPRHVVGADPTKPRTDAIGHFGRIANPTVHIGLNQLRRVVNRLIQIYGKPDEIVIEIARELKMSQEEKDKARKTNNDNERANRRREEQIRAAGGVPSADLLRKLRLWEEQKLGNINVCPFTGAPISFAMALTDATEIEHILPFSKTLDDSMANKILCLREVNRVKRDRAPFEAFQTNPQVGRYTCSYAEIVARADQLPPNKRWRFEPDAMQRYEEDAGFLDRQLNETKYLSRIARSYLSHLYDEKGEARLRVRAIPGKLTAMLRGKWGLNSLLRDHNRLGGDTPRKNRHDHRHHAIDAFVIAMTDQRLLQQIATLNSDADRRRLIDEIPEPWPGFTPDLLRMQIDRLVVSHKPDHATFGGKGTSGALHNDTAFGLIAKDSDPRGNVVTRAPLTSIKKREDLAWVRDKAMAASLGRLWDKVAAAGGKPADFAAIAEKEGMELGGRQVSVRRVRMISNEQTVVPIKDRQTDAVYKAYKPDGNAFADIYQMPDGRWQAVVIRRFDANQPGFDAARLRPHPAARKIMRLYNDDMVAVGDGPDRRILRIVKMSGQTIFLADHLEAGGLKKRDQDPDDAFKYLAKSANAFRPLNLRKIGIDEVGRVNDPGVRELP
jgi:CRISPR-associated endonuclease Csn1